MRHRRSSCDSYLIHGHAEYILCRTTYEYRSIGRGTAVAVAARLARGDHRYLRVYGYINYARVRGRSRAAARTHAKKLRGRATMQRARRVRRNCAAGNIALRFIRRPGTSSARIRGDTYPVTIYVINRRFVSTHRVVLRYEMTRRKSTHDPAALELFSSSSSSASDYNYVCRDRAACKRYRGLRDACSVWESDIGSVGEKVERWRKRLHRTNLLWSRLTHRSRARIFGGKTNPRQTRPH